MGLTDKLIELDQYFWKQHEKVTHYCNREYGWNKYDLVRKANLATYGSMFGEGTYLAIGGLVGDSLGSAALGGILSLVAAGAYSLSKKVIDRKEAREINLLIESGATEEPHFEAYRPASLFGFSLLHTYLAVSSFTGQFPVPEGLSVSPVEYNNLSGLFWTAAFFVTVFE
ncbi:MAG: hypothetical protein AABX31_06020, partial [Nanoarchaeota archaeon]